MTYPELLSILPYVVMISGIMVIVLMISFLRNHLTTVTVSIFLLLASLISIPYSLEHGSGGISGFMNLDGYTAFFNCLFIFSALVTVLFSKRYLSGRLGNPDEFYLLLLISTLGAMVLAAAEHFAVFLLGLEIMSISLYVLVAYPEEGNPPLEAALKYLVLSGVASTTMLFGMALVYNATGTLNVSGLAAGVPGIADGDQRFLVVGHGLLIIGLAFKLSLVPLHMWTPDVVQGAPAPVSGYLATVSKAAVFAFLMRYIFESDAVTYPAILQVLAFVAVLSMVVGNLLALRQRNLKRLLAYSSIAHAGYLIITVIVLVTVVGFRESAEAAMFYLVGYTLMTLVAFGVVGVLSLPSESADAESPSAYQGLFWRHPVLGTILSLALLSLAGIPLTVGFIAKFYLFTVGIEGGLWILVWALVLGSAIAIYYYLRAILAMTQKPLELSGSVNTVLPLGSMSVLVVLGLLILGFGVYPSPLIEVIRISLGVLGG